MSAYAGIVIVGASAAGFAAADGLREGGYTGAITVLDAEVDPGYDRPMISKGLLAEKEDRDLAPLRTRAQLEEKQITLLDGHAAVGLDIDRRLVVTSWGEAIGFDHVVVATGVSARPLITTGGVPLPTLRSRADLAAARSIAASGEPVTLVGAGFIGLEVASALRTRGIEVTVIDPVTLPLAGVVGEEVARWLHERHLAAGVGFELGVRPTSVEAAPYGYDLHLSDGRLRRAGAILAGIGAVPNTEWLIGSGIDLDGGVPVDESGRASVPGVWAAGDVASAPHGDGHRRFEHWTHAIDHGRHVGLNIARVLAGGEAEPYSGVAYVWTEQCGKTLHLLGERRPGDTDTVVEGSIDSGAYVVVHGSGEELHGATVCDLPRSLRTYKKLLRSGAPLSHALGS